MFLRNKKITQRITLVRGGDAGFTLVEMGMVLIISGLMLVAVIAAMDIAWKSMQRSKTNQLMTNVYNGMNGMSASNNMRRFPCPAPLGVGGKFLDPTDSDYGKEGARDALGNCLIPTGTHTIYKIVAKSLLTADGGDHESGDLNGDGVPDYILIGQLPLNAIGTGLNPAGGPNIVSLGSFLAQGSDTQAFQTNFIDPWGNPLLYAVTELATKQGYNSDFGGITIVDEFGNMTGGNTGHALWAAIDLGSNGGEQCVSFVPYQPADPYAVPPVPVTVMAHGVGDDELMNCTKTSAIFRQGIVRDATGHKHFDDRVVFSQVANAGIWQQVSSTANLLQLKSNLLQSNVGVNTANPTAKLDVNGTIKAASNVRAMEICDKTASLCVKPDSIYNISCPAGQYMASVFVDTSALGANKLTANCQPVGFKPPSTPVNCPGGVQGVYTNGEATCGLIVYDN